ncbi:MAG: ABC transporter ATP-binding protein [Lachnospiraceae bacterium]|nr:ABC transporter ATP-binding protein [Lachnospiraceae bacterium]
MRNVIEISHLTRDYGNHKGIFDININVKQGEVFGFLGPNGSGKTTTIRHLMGFIKAKEGCCTINQLDCFKDADQIQDNLGYLAGEIAFLDDLTGKRLIEFVASLKGIKNKSKIQELTEMFELDTKSKISKMSKGMKQKVGIVCAFMSDPQVIILDEPTSGLDPLMQNRFIDLLLAEKKRGKTIFMSSHIFEEVEKTCDRVAIIRNGEIVAIDKIDNLKQKKKKAYAVTLKTKEAADAFAASGYHILERVDNTVSISINGEISGFIKDLGDYDVKDLDIHTQSLEDIFLHYYGGQ